MTDDTMDQQNLYGSSDVAVLLKVKESTLRKYTLMLEEAGYKFHKNEYGQRGFFDHDVIALKKLIEIKNHPDMTLKQACNAVMTWVKENSMADRAIDDITPAIRHDDRYISEIEELKHLVSQQTELIKHFSMQLDQQQKVIEERDKRQAERDLKRDREWLEFVRQNQEEKKALLQIAAAQEEEKKKGFLARLFGK